MKKAAMALIFSTLILTGCAGSGITPYGQPCTTAQGNPGIQNIFGECYRDTRG